MTHSIQTRARGSSRPAVLLLAALAIVLGGTTHAWATKFTCTPPTAPGNSVISISFKTFGVAPTFCSLAVPIPAGTTAAVKASLIAAAINDPLSPISPCAPQFSATAIGPTVDVLDMAHAFAHKVHIRINGDTSGEKDTIEKELAPNWWGSGGSLFKCGAPASGQSWDGVSPGSITLGTPTYVANIPTQPGQTPFALLSLALADLNAHGVLNVTLDSLPNGAAQLHFNLNDNDAWIQVGADDSGVSYNFMMLFDCPGQPTADFNGDEERNGRDISYFTDAFLASSNDPDDICAGDFSGNLVLDIADLDGFITAVLAKSPACGALFNETFSYPNGSLAGNPGWTTHSGTVGQMQVASGKAVVNMTQSEDVNKLIGATLGAGGTFYAAMDVTVSHTAPLPEVVAGISPPSVEYFASFKDPGGTAFRSRIFTTGIAGSDYTYGLRASSGINPESTWFSGFSFGTTQRVVVSFEFDTGLARLWVNPTNILSTSISATGGALQEIVAFALRQSSAGTQDPTHTVDNLNVATTFDDAFSCGSGLVVVPASTAQTSN